MAYQFLMRYLMPTFDKFLKVHFGLFFQHHINSSRTSWLVEFYGILTFMGYLMPNYISLYMFNQRFLNEYFVDNLLD